MLNLKLSVLGRQHAPAILLSLCPVTQQLPTLERWILRDSSISETQTQQAFSPMSYLSKPADLVVFVVPVLEFLTEQAGRKLVLRVPLESLQQFWPPGSCLTYLDSEL